jgi:murein DD-endopeptidase MepM/ murein hydrolase activator NlpD
MTLVSSPRRSPSAGLVAVAAVLFVVAVVGGGVAVWAGMQGGGIPQIELVVPDAVGVRGEVRVVVDEPVRGVVDVVVTVAGAGLAPQTLAELHEAPPSSAFAAPTRTRAELQAPIGKAVMPGLTAGTLTVTVTATHVARWWRQAPPTVVEKSVVVRLTPPTVSPVSSFVYVTQGGAEVAVYDVGEGSVSDGVVVDRVGGGDPWVFPGAPVPGASPTRRFAFFVLPYDDEGPEDAVQQRVQLYAEDALGNRSTAGGVVHKAFVRRMGRDTIALSDAFLQKVTTSIRTQTPDLPPAASPLQDYLWINRELRARNNAFLVELAKKSAPRFLWSRVFQPFDNAAIKGAFADRRLYEHAGAVVDTQDHLGFDLARVEQSPVNAGNDGVVVHAAPLGIYGNCVVLDHGFGLQTLYAHLSSIAVKEGETVARGATLGRTGATGLAGGDHLHFTTLVHGRPTNPIEWWDAHWITDRVQRKLGDAFPFDATTDSAGRRR